jgi:sugar lactone lactonase YvrE
MWERSTDDLRTLVDGLEFPEAPRWHDGRVWFVDMRGQRIARVDLDGGAPETVVQHSHHPSGLGWLPDGRLLFVSMQDRRLMRQEPDGTIVEVADLTATTGGNTNDMLVDHAGRAYVGNFGYDTDNEEPRGASICRVDPDGSVTIAAEGLDFPNGTVLTPDRRTMIIGESVGHRLRAFDVDDDGTLSNMRVWAQLDGVAPDGICLDSEGAVWVASPISKEVLRVAEGGEILGRVTTGTRRPLACMLVGEERRTLVMCTVGRHRETEAGITGKLEAIDVEVPGAGLP